MRVSSLYREAVRSAAAAAALAATLAWAGPPGSDLAAHVYQRADFAQHGFLFWNNFWYAGRYSFITYSLLYYPLAALLGIRLLAVAAIATATLAFVVVVWRQWGPASRWSSRTFAIVWAGIVLSAAFPFALGAALALLALWAVQTGRLWRFAGLSLLTLMASPVAFLLLTVVLVGVAVGKLRERRRITLVGLALIAGWTVEFVLTRVFGGGGGRFPFSAEELGAACLFCASGAALSWRVERARSIRWLFPIYGAACIASYLVSSAVGENVTRLRYVAVPVAVLVLTLREWRPRGLAVVALAGAIAWNVSPLAGGFASGSSDRSANAAYWAPAIGFLHGHLTPSYRVEAVDTAGHWAADYLPGAGIPIARGWFRQDDFPQNEILYGPLGPRSYLAWLRRLGVRYVVLTDAAPDFSARAEAALVRSGRSGLRTVFQAAHLTVYAVPRARSLLSGPTGARVLELSDTEVRLSIRRAATYRLAMRFSPYWRSSVGCVSQTSDGMTRLTLPRAGEVSLRFQLDAGRALASLTGTPATDCAA